jgi:Tfp pilus assembly protein PilF
MLDETMTKVLELYNKGLDCYKKKEFGPAKELFRQALEVRPDDGPSKLYLERCELLIQNPPPADWDGVFTMTSK